jgi:predicted 3-demethylubiquinone-9 3-methyltransferase (glyoxalase superfamily)
MQKIIPHLWFDKEAKEASSFYTSVFPNSKIRNVAKITGTPSGDCDVVSFDIMGFSLQAISAGPYFKLNPAISFMVNFDPSQDPDARKRIDEIWEKLIEGGKALMPIDKYPFSERYGWVEDKFGVSWQLILTNPEGEERPLIIPSIMFTKERSGKAEEATDFYISVFKDSKRGAIARYPEGMESKRDNEVMFTDFKLLGQWFAAMDGGKEPHEFEFNEAVSFIVYCDTQEEIDYYFEKLSAVPESEQCGWLKDKYGVSWQIVPTIMEEVMASGDQDKIDRLTKAFLPMKKLDIKKLEEVR